MQLEEDYLKEHYTNPQNNVALEKYNAKGICKNPDNSGEVSMYLLVDKNQQIQQIGYEYIGCPIIAFVASIFSENIKFCLIDEALKVAKIELKEVDLQEMDDCLKMIFIAFIAAYENYFGDNSDEFTLKYITITNSEDIK
jgi:NifU-like protein involved in Fe-S cluster formation